MPCSAKWAAALRAHPKSQIALVQSPLMYPSTDSRGPCSNMQCSMVPKHPCALVAMAHDPPSCCLAGHCPHHAAICRDPQPGGASGSHAVQQGPGVRRGLDTAAHVAQVSLLLASLPTVLHKRCTPGHICHNEALLACVRRVDPGLKG